MIVLQADIEAFTTEMEVIGAAYEDMQAKNSRLLQQIAEKDAKNSQVRGMLNLQLVGGLIGIVKDFQRILNCHYVFAVLISWPPPIFLSSALLVHQQAHTNNQGIPHEALAWRHQTDGSSNVFASGIAFLT